MRRVTSLGTFAILVLASVVFVACGGGSDAGNSADAADDVQAESADGDDHGSESGTGEGDDAGSGDDTGGESPGGDLGDVPEPGRAILEVDGETFEGAVGECNFNEDGGQVTGFRVDSTIERDGSRINFGASGGREGDSDWMGQSVVMIDGDVAYSSSNVGNAQVSLPSVVLQGEYVWAGDDGGMDSGEGRFAATCP